MTIPATCPQCNSTGTFWWERPDGRPTSSPCDCGTQKLQPPALGRSVQFNSYIAIYNDARGWIVWDDNEEEAHIFPTWESALLRAEEQAEMREAEMEDQSATQEDDRLPAIYERDKAICSYILQSLAAQGVATPVEGWGTRVSDATTELCMAFEAAHAQITRLKSAAKDLHWMARRYADGRQSYATGMHNDATRELLELGVPLDGAADGTLWARDSAGRAYDGLTDEEAAEGRQPDWRHDDKERMLEAAGASIVKRDALISQMRSALDRSRLLANGLLARHSVRDAAESLAEMDAAIAAADMLICKGRDD